MGYHKKEIPKGVYGFPCKIREEFEEFQDALDQGNSVMELIELSDMLGAIDAYTKHTYGIDLNKLIIMKEATERAFKDGTRN